MCSEYMSAQVPFTQGFVHIIDIHIIVNSGTWTNTHIIFPS